MNTKKILTMADLVRFCEEQKLYKFSSKQSGYQLCVHIPSLFEVQEDDSRRGLLKLKIKVFHIGLNRNGSYVSEESAKKAMPSLKNRPVLANIHKLDNGDWDFLSHDMTIGQDEDGNEEITYIEKQVGSFTEDDPFLEYDTDTDKTYVVAYAVIPREYTKAAEILERKNGTKNSCELFIDEFSYNAKEKYLSLDDFYVSASTLLGSRNDGTEIQEGMVGSRADITDFSAENNSLIEKDYSNKKVIELLEGIYSNISGLNINNNFEEGGNKKVKFDELLTKYNVSKDDINFDYESLSDEELEYKFAELFGENNTVGFDATSDYNEDSINATKFGYSRNGIAVDFELSHEDIRYALYNLISQYDELDNDWYFIDSVFDDHFIMRNWDGDKIFGQKYIKDGDNISFDGERWELYQELLTASEKASLDEMRKNYSLVCDELQKYHNAEFAERKKDILNDTAYDKIRETENFKELTENIDNFSVEELQSRTDALLLSYIKSNVNFASNETTPKKNKVHIPFNNKTEMKKSPYGNLFADEK